MASAARRDLDKLRQETEAERRKLEADRAKYQAKAKDEARRIVEDTRREMDKLIADVRSIKGVDRSAADRVIQQSRDALRKRRDDLAEKLVLNKEDGTKPPKTVNPGDTVRIVSLDKKATVLSRPDSKGEVQVLSLIHIWMCIRDRYSTEAMPARALPNAKVKDMVRLTLMPMS